MKQCINVENKLFNKQTFIRLVTGSTFLIIFFTFFFKYEILFSILIFTILLIILFFEWPKLLKNNKNLFWLTPIYPALSFILIILLNTTQYRKLILNLFLLVFSFDTGAFIFGKLFGKNKICPKISPAKSWQGFFGGYFLVFVNLILYFIFINKKLNLIFIILFSLLISILSFVGDLFESYLKRRAQLKDTGNLLPGHGGFLDRFDSALIIIFIYYFFKDFLIFIF